jgi:hypothetical protein
MFRMLSVLKVTQRGPPTCTITTLPAASDGGVGPRFAHLAPLRRGLVGKKPHIAWVAPRVGGAGAELTRATRHAPRLAVLVLVPSGFATQTLHHRIQVASSKPRHTGLAPVPRPPGRAIEAKRGAT